MKWFCRWHFQMHFLQWKQLYFDFYFYKSFSSQVQLLHRWQAYTFANVGQDVWCHRPKVSFGHNVFKQRLLSQNMENNWVLQTSSKMFYFIAFEHPNKSFLRCTYQHLNLVQKYFCQTIFGCLYSISSIRVFLQHLEALEGSYIMYKNYWW